MPSAAPSAVRSACHDIVTPPSILNIAQTDEWLMDNAGASPLGGLLALCHWRACRLQALRDPRSILVGEW